MKRLALFSLFIFLGVVSVASAQEISFPVAELGNCESKEACREYCENEANIEACVAFAKSNGINTGDAENAKQFSKILKEKGGPGGCKSPTECEAYCGDSTRMDECLAFAEANGLLDKEKIAEIKAMAGKFKQGFTGPGGCTSKESCEAYCSDAAHQDECLTFAEKHGFVKKDEVERMKKFRELQSRGETPGGCNSKESCESYCSDTSHQEECFAFAETSGLATKEDLERFKKTGGKGPGGCASKEACESFCNAKENQAVCLEFAKSHGFIKDGDAKHIEEGFSRIRQGLEHAPPEIQTCLKEKFGEGFLEKAKSGEFAPNLQGSEGMRQCFEANREATSRLMGRRFNDSPETLACVKAAAGEETAKEIFEGNAPPRPEIADALRACFTRPHGDPEEDRPIGGEEGREFNFEELDQKGREAFGTMQSCVGAKLGAEAAEKMKVGKLEMTEDVRNIMQSCQESFRALRRRPEDGDQRGLEQGRNLISKMRPCLVEKVGEELVKSFESGQLPPDQTTLRDAMQSCSGQIDQGSGVQPGMPSINEFERHQMDNPEFNREFPTGEFNNQGFPTRPPDGTFEGGIPPTGIQPPAGFIPPPEVIPGTDSGQFTPPPSFESFTPPPTLEPSQPLPPSSFRQTLPLATMHAATHGASIPLNRFFNSVLSLFLLK